MKQTKHFFVWLPLAVVIFLLASLALSTNIASAAGEFTTTWKTDIENSGDASIELSIYRNPRYSYNYTVDWGDGTVTTYIDRNAAHTYDSPGTYQLKISGSFPRLYLANGPDAHKLVSVDNWGDIAWQSMSRAFEGARNMTIRATDTPDTSAVTNFSFAFKDASQFTGGIANWDVSNATDFRSMFESASSFDESLANWNVENMTLATSIFAESGMTTASYDATLIGWEATAAQRDVNLSPIGLPHCQAATSVAYLTDVLDWIITDQGQDTSLCGPTDIEISSGPLSVSENSSNVVIGVLSAVDIEQGQSYAYSVGCSQSTDNTFFSMNNDELVLTTTLDYENPQDENGDNIYAVCVSATDSDGFSTSKEFEITVSDVEETQPEPDADIDDEGAVLGASTNSDNSSSDNEGGQVLGASSEESVLAETGQAILLALFVGAGLSILVTILVRKTSTTYSLRK